MRLLATVVLLLALSGFAVPQKPTQDVQGDMVIARQHLVAARDLAYRAGDAWGGHRVNALNHINAAIQEVDKGEAYAKAHHYIK